ncbi:MULTISPECIES: hypothetical protein [Colwelliaceae]|uniref:hypothetical protein n=1 Tax=Colwelliaceae TaxID=267889 RepID=UPI0009707073|nr:MULTISPECIES: hypothetical protein [Colwelliaceae]
MEQLKKCKVALLIAGVCCSAPSIADVKFNGFASIKGGLTFDDPKDRNSNGNFDAEEVILDGLYDKDLSFKPESLFALQVSSDLGEGLSVTAQLYAEGRNDFDLEARWAYLSYDITDEWRVNVGRMVLPMFYKSESEKIGYTVIGNRLPRSVYDDFNFSVVEGVRLNNSTELGDWSINSSFGYYSWEGDWEAFDSLYNTKFDKILSVSTEFNYDWLTLFAGGFITEADFSELDNAVLFDGPTGINNAAASFGVSADETARLRDTVGLSGDGEYYYLGAAVDYNDWLFTAEYADYGIKDSGNSFSEVYYVMAGKRINEYTILYTYESFDQPIDYSSLNDFTPAAQAIGKNVVDALFDKKFKTQTLSLRYDFHSSAAFKIDVFRTKLGDFSDNYNGASFGIDLVF